MTDEDYEDSDCDYEDDEDPDFDCGWTPEGGGCSLAGTEDCDFECPYRDDMIRDLKRRRK